MKITESIFIILNILILWQPVALASSTEYKTLPSKVILIQPEVGLKPIIIEEDPPEYILYRQDLDSVQDSAIEAEQLERKSTMTNSKFYADGMSSVMFGGTKVSISSGAIDSDQTLRINGEETGE